MLLYNEKKDSITSTTGGYQESGLQIRDTFVMLARNFRCILYEPVLPVKKSEIGIICIHSDEDYSTFPIGGEMARRGYRTLCGQVSKPNGTLDQKMLDIKKAVNFMRGYPGIKTVILMGHSGGATLMSAYQAAAEKGVEVFQTETMLVKCSLYENLPQADGFLMLDSNWGNGAMTLLSIDPAVTEEGSGRNLNPELDSFAPENGYNPNGSHYDDSFLKKFYAAQADRNRNIVETALERLDAIEHGEGSYTDDEPFVVAGAAQFGSCNKLIPEDVRLTSHTKEAYPLLHEDGSVTTEIIHSVRRPAGGHPVTQDIFACAITTVRSYLTNRAVLTDENYMVKEDGVEGILWDNTYNCPPGNIKNITVPLLVMGMTGSYEYLAAETIYHNSPSADKSIAFVEGAGHTFDNRGREEYGDTQKLAFDYVDEWLATEGRFLM